MHGLGDIVRMNERRAAKAEIERAARHAVEATDPAEHHDLHRLADDGCPHHDEGGEAMPDVVQNSDHDWISWSGGECPVPKGVAGDVKLANDSILSSCDLAIWDWSRRRALMEAATYVVAYRVTEPARAVAEAKAAAYGLTGKSADLFVAAHLPTDAKARKALPICTGVLDYFPDALAAVAEVSRIGNDQHNPGQPLHWSKGKSTDHADCAARHLMERGTRDTDGGRHTAKAAWRVLALLQTEIEAERAGVSYAYYVARLNRKAA